MQFFYAVRVGKQPGVYRTWAECAEQVKGFPGTKYKKFKSIAEAQEYVGGSTNIPVFNSSSSDTPAPQLTDDAPSAVFDDFEEFDQPQTSFKAASSHSHSTKNNRAKPYSALAGKLGQRSFSTLSKRQFSSMSMQEFPPADIHFPIDDLSTFDPIPPQISSTFQTDTDAQHRRAVVYTDGCCHSNGQQGAVAGIGVYWGDNSPHNIAEPLAGRPTNNRAEIQAAVKAILQAREMGMTGINICTDSQFLINSTTLWMSRWQRNNWMTLAGKPVANKEDFEALIFAMDGMEVEWTHVRGHQGIYGNEKADELANAGARKTVIADEANVSSI